MHQIVDSVNRVTDIMCGISTASGDQRTGIEQINQAIGQMDEITQQNAALVEQSAAAAESMHEQAIQLAQAVSAFKLNGPDHPVATDPKPIQTASRNVFSLSSRNAQPPRNTFARTLHGIAQDDTLYDANGAHLELRELAAK